jgi:site-specific recombinase XerD
MNLLDRLAEVARLRRLAANTCDAYSGWVRDFLRFSRGADGAWRHPADLGTHDVERYLNDLVGRRRLSASSQNQALNALVFLYRHVLDTIPQAHLGRFELLRSRRVPRVPTVLSAGEVARVVACVPERCNYRLLVKLLYGTGLRVSEGCTLRVRDIDLERAQVIVRGGKGGGSSCSPGDGRHQSARPAGDGLTTAAAAAAGWVSSQSMWEAVRASP